MDIFNNNCLSPAMQLDKNTKDIETLFKNQAYFFRAKIDTLPNDITIDIQDTDILEHFTIEDFQKDNTFLPPQFLIISTNANLYKIDQITYDGKVFCQYITTFPQGEGFNFKGEWASNNEYHKNDVVTYTSNGVVTAYVLTQKELLNSEVPPPQLPDIWKVFAGGATQSVGMRVTLERDLYTTDSFTTSKFINGNLQSENLECKHFYGYSSSTSSNYDKTILCILKFYHKDSNELLFMKSFTPTGMNNTVSSNNNNYIFDFNSNSFRYTIVHNIINNGYKFDIYIHCSNTEIYNKLKGVIEIYEIST